MKSQSIYKVTRCLVLDGFSRQVVFGTRLTVFELILLCYSSIFSIEMTMLVLALFRVNALRFNWLRGLNCDGYCSNVNRNSVSQFIIQS